MNADALRAVGSIVADTTQSIQAVAWVVAIYFLREFVAGVRELKKTVDNHGQRLASLETLAGVEVEVKRDTMSELTPKKRVRFTRHKDG